MTRAATKGCLAAMAIATLAGCTTMADVEASKPYYEGRFAGEYQSVSACIVLAWNRLSGGRFQQVVDPADSTAFIIGTPGPFTAIHVSHTTVRQVGEGTVAVEYRKPPRLLGTPDWVWDSVEDCGRGSA